MEKLALVLRRPADRPAEEFDAAYAASGPIDETRSIHVVRRTTKPAAFDGLTFLWGDGASLGRALEREQEMPAAFDAYRVDEVRHWDRLPPPDDDGWSPGVKMIVLFRRRADLCVEDFRERYLEHAPLARENHPGIARYVQNFVRAPVDAASPPFDALVEIHFATEEDRRERFYRDAESPAIIDADVARFMDRESSWSVLATERCGGHTTSGG